MPYKRSELQIARWSFGLVMTLTDFPYKCKVQTLVRINIPRNAPKQTPTHFMIDSRGKEKGKTLRKIANRFAPPRFENSVMISVSDRASIRFQLFLLVSKGFISSFSVDTMHI